MTSDTVELMPWNECFEIDHQKKVVQLNPSPMASNAPTAYNKAFQDVIDGAIDQDHFAVLHGEHSEPYIVQGAKFPLHIERFAAGLFGIASRGAHMTAYTRTSTGELRIWVARRSAHIFTYPGKLDTTIAGGVKAQHTPLQCIIEESYEEATLSRDIVKQNIHSVGVVTYMTQNKNERIHPDVLYVFDLELPEEVIPQPNDEEVSEFVLLTVDEVKKAMFDREFKANCNLVMIDFFIRHGIITPDDEPEYSKLQARLHRILPIPTYSDEE